MSGTTYNLDFTLVIETYNHEIITQTPDDKSRTDPTRSFFYDVKDLHIKKASLVGKGHIITIDLEDGHAEIDGRIAYPPAGSRPPEATNRKLIYYRTVPQETTLTASLERDNKHNLLAKILRKDGLKPKVRYYIGWQVSHNSKNYKWELGID
jgi:hypothetical protein